MPAYNEEECITKVVTNWIIFLERFIGSGTFHFIVVNDGSKDETGKILDGLEHEHSQLMVVHQENGGHGKAVIEGYAKAISLGSEWIFQVDSDDQFEISDFAKLWENRNKSKFILGYRRIRYDAVSRLLITRILRFALFVFFGENILDSNIPFRLMEGDFLSMLLKKLPDEYPFAPNIFLAVLARKNGQQTIDIPVKHKDRQTGTISILRWNLLRVCFRSLKELIVFRASLLKHSS